MNPGGRINHRASNRIVQNMEAIGNKSGSNQSGFIEQIDKTNTCAVLLANCRMQDAQVGPSLNLGFLCDPETVLCNPALLVMRGWNQYIRQAVSTESSPDVIIAMAFFQFASSRRTQSRQFGAYVARCCWGFRRFCSNSWGPVPRHIWVKRFDMLSSLCQLSSTMLCVSGQSVGEYGDCIGAIGMVRYDVSPIAGLIDTYDHVSRMYVDWILSEEGRNQ